MNSSLSEVAKALEQSDVMAHLARPPDVGLIPYMGNRESFYILVSLVLKEGSASGETAINVVEAATHAILNAHDFSELPGLEILPCAIHNGRVQKFFRFSLKRSAFKRALKPFARDLLQSVPFEDATCGWYVAMPLIPITKDLLP